MGGSSEPKPQKSKQNTITNSKTKSTSNTTGQSSTSVTAPTWVQDAWRGSLGDYGDIREGFADIPPELLQSWGMAGDVAHGVDPYSAIDTSLRTMSDTARGDYLYGGDAFNAAVDAAFRQGMPGVLSSFAAGGRSDGGLAKTAMAQAFADPFAAQYGQERLNQLKAAGLLPGLALTPSSIMESIGQGKDARTLQQAQLALGELGFLQPWLGQDSSFSSKTSGTSTTKGKNAVAGVVTPSFYEGNSLAQGAGGALSGAATGASIGSVVPGIGTGIGALAGGLIGGIGSIF